MRTVRAGTHHRQRRRPPGTPRVDPDGYGRATNRRERRAHRASASASSRQARSLLWRPVSPRGAPMHIPSALVSALSGSPILTLFVVIGLGFVLGQIRLFGFRFGIAGVLFVGLAVGSLSPLITLPEVVPTLGLVLFVYATGIGTGRAFFNAFGREGYRANAVAAGALTLGALVTFALGRLLGVPAPVLAGMY